MNADLHYGGKMVVLCTVQHFVYTHNYFAHCRCVNYCSQCVCPSVCQLA